MCLSPHPDDIEIAMMGSVIKFTETHFDILCMTKGGAKGFDPTNARDRRREVDQCWSKINSTNFKVIHSHVDYFEDLTEPGWINYIEKQFIDINNYDALFVPSGLDSMLEHRLVNRIGPPLCRKPVAHPARPLSLIEYHICSTLNEWVPNLFVDIGAHLQSKLNALSVFVSQSEKGNGYFDNQAQIAFHTNYQCAKKGYFVAEKFRIIDLFT